MIIGPSAAGKSTLLRHSNLNFPYSANDQIDIKGFAGTRNCDWWFADEAILLDTAGRYTMEDSDQAEWVAFLQLLRKHRPRSPINGVIVTLSLEDIIRSDKKGLIHHVQMIRQKLDELNRQLGIVIPVQLVVTKCDLLEGFSDFFKDMSPEAREQPWGGRLQGHDFKSTMTRLVNKLTDLRLHKLPMSPQLIHKHAIMKFPHHFEEASEKVVFFLENLTLKNHFQEQPDFMGVYFTSALSERSYFIKDLFRKIIFKQRTTNKNARQHKLHSRLKILGAGLAFCLTIGAGILLESGYRLQTELYAKQSSLLQSLRTDSSYDQLTSLLKIYQHYTYLKDIEHKSLWRFTLGFNSLKTQIHETEKLYAAYFTPLMAKPAMQSLESIIRDKTNQWSSLSKSDQANQYANFYDNLKAYLMLSKADRLEAGFEGRVLNNSWEEYVQMNQPAIPLSLSATATEPLFEAYFRIIQSGSMSGSLPKINQSLVHGARQALYMSPDPSILYQHLVSRGMHDFAESTIQEILAGKDQGFFANQYTLPKMYTRQTYEKKIIPIMEEIVANAGTGDWVLQDKTLEPQDKSQHQKWLDEVKALYFKDYVKHWMNWLSGLEVRSFHSLDDAATKLISLQRDDGPLISVLKQVDFNLDINEHDLKTAHDSMSWLTKQDALSQYRSQLAVIQTEVSALSDSSDPHRDAELYSRKVLSETREASLSTAMNSINGLTDLGQESKTAITAFLRSPIEKSWRAVLDAAGTHIQSLWDAEVLSVYNQSLKGRFPFAKTQMEVAVDDVSQFFNPKDGAMSQFHETVLKPYLKSGKNGWTENEWLGEGIGFSQAFLTSMSQAQEITYALFKPGSSDPKFTFYIQPVPLPGVEEIIFDSNGQEYRYRNEPEEWRRFTWPGEASQIGARLYVSANQNKHSGEIEHHGLWGLFHLLSDAKFVKQGGTQYMTEWRISDRGGQPLSVKIKIKADKQSNVLDPRVMTQFKLPDNIKDNHKARA